MPIPAVDSTNAAPPQAEYRQVADPWAGMRLTGEGGFIISGDSLSLAMARQDSLSRSRREIELQERSAQLNKLDIILRRSSWLGTEKSPWPAQIKAAAAEYDLRSLRHLISTFEAPGLLQLNPAQRLDLITIFNSLGPNGRAELLQTLQRRDLENNQTCLLDLDARGSTLLANLKQLSFQPLDLRIGLSNEAISRKALMRNLLSEIARPSVIPIPVYGSCTALLISTELLERNPAEYVRLLTGLVSQGGQATLRGGGTLQRVDDYFTALKSQKIPPSLSQLLVASAMMDFGNGPSMDFSATVSRRINKASADTLGVGLLEEEFKSLAEQTFGRRYRVVRGQRAIEELRRNNSPVVPGLPILLTLSWRPEGVTDDNLPPQSIISDDARVRRHAVSYAGHSSDNSLVFVRDAADRTKVFGRQLKYPPRVVVDANKHVAAFSRSEFEKRLDYALIPEPTLGEHLRAWLDGIKRFWNQNSSKPPRQQIKPISAHDPKFQ